jgi:hypothetical protein
LNIFRQNLVLISCRIFRIRLVVAFGNPFHGDWYYGLEMSSGSRRPDRLTKWLPILLGNTAETFTTDELSRLLQNLFILIKQRTHCGMSLISILTRSSGRRLGEISGFAGISAKCASARRITQWI